MRVSSPRPSPDLCDTISTLPPQTRYYTTHYTSLPPSSAAASRDSEWRCVPRHYNTGWKVNKEYKCVLPKEYRVIGIDTIVGHVSIIEIVPITPLSRFNVTVRLRSNMQWFQMTIPSCDRCGENASNQISDCHNES
jgi:hypothetical protein